MRLLFLLRKNAEACELSTGEKNGVRKPNDGEMVDLNELNELYNILDLYIVSSRYEGGPRSIIECGLTKTPIISTDVGIAPDILHEKSIFDVNNIYTYRNTIINTEVPYNNSIKLNSEEYLPQFYNELFNL